jgi:type I restriction enzyme S subunit
MNIAAHPRYENYQDTGVEWLGTVPSAWVITRLGTVFTERRTKVSDKDYEPLSVTKNGILQQLDSAAKTNDGDNRKLVKKGDFVINSRSDRKGSSGVSPLDGSVSLINIVLQPKGIHPDFCNYVLKSYAFVEEYYRMGHGIVADLWTTRYDEMRGILMALPSPDEQRAIAAFLDDKCAKIDGAVKIKEDQIALLRERRQIIIQDAVTRGLNSAAPMKDSGIDWIGQIPKHWDVKKLKFASKIFRGKFTHRPRNDPRLYDGLYPFFQTGDVARAGMFLSDYRQTLNELGLRVSTLIPKGTILITIAANIGDVAILDIDACFPDSVVGFRPRAMIERDFLFYSMSAMKTIFMNTSIANAQANLNVERIGGISITLPPKDEQLSIIGHIEANNTKIEAGIAIKERQIAALKEYKTSLINAAVTGKIKVI